MRSARNLLMACVLGLAMAATLVASAASADSPSAILAARHRDIAACVREKGQVKLLLRLNLDKDAHVQSVEIESETTLGKKCRRCIESKLIDLQFTLDLAGQTIEHEMVVVHSQK